MLSDLRTEPHDGRSGKRVARILSDFARSRIVDSVKRLSSEKRVECVARCLKFRDGCKSGERAGVSGWQRPSLH